MDVDSEVLVSSQACVTAGRRIKYYNNVLFHSVQQNFIVQTGDPTGTGKGGTSINGCVLLLGACTGILIAYDSTLQSEHLHRPPPVPAVFRLPEVYMLSHRHCAGSRTRCGFAVSRSQIALWRTLLTLRQDAVQDPVR